MRVLVLLRGAPGCGKSTWIKENNLQDFALSADELRMMCSSPQLSADGDIFINQKNDHVVWDTLMKILEIRMQNGEFTVIDATNSKTSEMNKYKSLCKDYRYRIYCVDFTDIPIEEVKRRNAQREPLKRVPEEVIDKMYSRFATQKIPSGITALKPDELDKVWYKPADISSYSKVNVIGDIHGCYTALMGYLSDGIEKDEYYIFCGDYLDRGLENAEVMKYLLSICKLPNTYFIEGNHERHLWNWAHDTVSRSKEFEFKTKRQLEDAGISKSEVRSFYRSLGQCSYFTYHGKTFIVTHGGISKITDNLTKISTDQMIRGVGLYEDHAIVANTFSKLHHDDSVYQIHGHRNVLNHAIDEVPGVFNLEGRVEFGGYLRCLELNSDGTYNTVCIKNSVFKAPEEKTTDSTEENMSVEKMVYEFRKNKNVHEKYFKNISSFNFTKSAFYKRNFDSCTVKARGIFVDTEKMQIVARSYNKFFNIGEREDCSLDALKDKFKFPVTAYVKENGFLGMLAYNRDEDDLMFASKSTINSDFCNIFKDIFYSTVGNVDAVKEYLKANNSTLVFEVISPDKDPHIIKYDKPKVVLLDIVHNTVEYSKEPYEAVVKAAKEFGLEYKHESAIFYDWPSFVDFYNEVNAEGYKFLGNYIEGYVFEDEAGYMVKQKTYYYRYWKHLRGIADEVLYKGYTTRTSSLTDSRANYFYGFLKAYYEENNPAIQMVPANPVKRSLLDIVLHRQPAPEIPQKKPHLKKDIITLRDMFYATENGAQHDRVD